MNNVIPAGQSPAPIIDIIPASMLTNSARDAMKRDAWQRLLNRAVEKRIVNSDFSNAIVRELRPTADLAYGANANQDWLTTALVANTFNPFVNNVTVPLNQMFVFYGISVLEASPSVGEMRFERGTTGTGGINSIVNLATLYDKLELECYLSKGILYDPQDIIYIGGLPFKANAAGERYVLHGYVCEPVGLTLAAQPE